jgi:hypothetical protein
MICVPWSRYYGFATIDAAAKLRREHAATYAKQISSLEAELARKDALLKEKEAARRNVEQLAGQQQKILQNLNGDLDKQRNSRSGRESFLEMQLKDAMKKVRAYEFRRVHFSIAA